MGPPCFKPRTDTGFALLCLHWSQRFHPVPFVSFPCPPPLFATLMMTQMAKRLRYVLTLETGFRVGVGHTEGGKQFHVPPMLGNTERGKGFQEVIVPKPMWKRTPGPAKSSRIRRGSRPPPLPVAAKSGGHVVPGQGPPLALPFAVGAETFSLRGCIVPDR